MGHSCVWNPPHIALNCHLSSSSSLLLPTDGASAARQTELLPAPASAAKQYSKHTVQMVHRVCIWRAIQNATVGARCDQAMDREGENSSLSHLYGLVWCEKCEYKHVHVQTAHIYVCACCCANYPCVHVCLRMHGRVSSEMCVHSK